MKGLPGDAGVRLPVRDEDMREIGFLKAFDRADLDDRALIETMAEARTRFKEFFLTQFDATPENKRAWLETSVLGNDGKVLFLVETLEGVVVGQDGFTVLEDGSFELDGTMRWARGGHMRLFEMIGIEKARICFGLLDLSLCRIELFKKNAMAAYIVRKGGFAFEKEYSLSVSHDGGKVIYTRTDAESANTDEKLWTFSMDREGFERLHGKLTGLAGKFWGSTHWKG
jgi:hypothetical protein